MECVIGYVKAFTSKDSSSLLPGIIKQKNEIKKYCDNNGLELLKIIVEKVDNEQSDTPLLNEIVYRKIDDKRINKVILFKSSIFSKDFRFYLFSLFTLAKREIELISIKEDFIKDEKITLRDKKIIFAMAFFEKKRTGYLFSTGIKEKTRTGDYIPGFSPFGYRKVNGNYEIDASEAEVVKLIFKKKEKQNKTFTEIANFLNKNGIKTKQGKSWTRETVSGIIKNKNVYKGYVYSSETKTFIKGKFEPIL